jgi:hypothetical protein
MRAPGPAKKPRAACDGPARGTGLVPAVPRSCTARQCAARAQQPTGPRSLSPSSWPTLQSWLRRGAHSSLAFLSPFLFFSFLSFAFLSPPGPPASGSAAAGADAAPQQPALGPAGHEHSAAQQIAVGSLQPSFWTARLRKMPEEATPRATLARAPPPTASADKRDSISLRHSTSGSAAGSSKTPGMGIGPGSRAQPAGRRSPGPSRWPPDAAVHSRTAQGRKQVRRQHVTGCTALGGRPAQAAAGLLGGGALGPAVALHRRPQRAAEVVWRPLRQLACAGEQGSAGELRLTCLPGCRTSRLWRRPHRADVQ